MTLQYTLDDFNGYKFEENRFNSPSVKTIIEQCGFKNNIDTFALIGCGGTISSAYSPTNENIRPTHFSPINDALNELNISFGIAEDKTSFLSLINKDSRDMTKDDIVFIMDILNGIESKRIVLTVGTYGLPMFTQIVEKCIDKDKCKIVCVTGSMLISSIKENDTDFNGGGAISSVNALSKLAAIETSTVYASFHGKIYKPYECADLELHLNSHTDAEFYRGQRLTKAS